MWLIALLILVIFYLLFLEHVMTKGAKECC